MRDLQQVAAGPYTPSQRGATKILHEVADVEPGVDDGAEPPWLTAADTMILVLGLDDIVKYTIAVLGMEDAFTTDEVLAIILARYGAIKSTGEQSDDCEHDEDH